MTDRPDGRERAIQIWMRVGWGLAALALVAIGALWQLDRSRGWEAPRWDTSRYVALAVSDPPTAEEAGETWVVAVHPGCPHCQVSLRQALLTRDRERSPLRIAALIVDTERRPPATLAADLGADECWWDAENRWRRRWGHRIYGEVLCFDARGTLLRQLAPLTESEDTSISH